MSQLAINTFLQNEIETLRQKLDEANETINAIRTGQVDALLVQEDNGIQLYTLKSADQTYRIFIEKMNEGAVTINKDGIVLYCNSRFADTVKMPLTKVIGFQFIDFVAQDFLEKYTDLIEKGWVSESKGEICLADSGQRQMPFLLSVTKIEVTDGHALSLLLTDLSIQKENERVLRLKNVALKAAELTARKLNEELEHKVHERTKDLLLSRERFKFLADNIPVIIWTADTYGNFDYANKRWYEYSGLNFQQTENNGWFSALHPDDVESTTANWQKAIKERKPIHMEYRIKRALDGLFRWHICSASPFTNEEGQVMAWFATCTDIHDQKLTIERKEEFIGIASHELKTPLTGLKGYMQLMELSKDELSPTFFNYFKKANKSIEKLQHLINDLLDVSRIQAGKLQFDTEIIAVNDLINNRIEESRMIYPDFKFTSSCPQGLYVKVNRDRVEQVMVNLIDNAVKFSDSKKEIDIDVVAEKDAVSVSVTDYGIGLTPENKDKIFERFYRVEELKYKTNGLGMGLYISSEIIKMHKGHMDVTSQLDKGSSFSFTLPLYQKQ